MGSGQWSVRSFDSTYGATLAAGGSGFAYSDIVRSLPRDQRTVHASVDPKLLAGAASPFAGQVMRECIDTPEHPFSTPIAIVFDVTGSMHRVPVGLQKALPGLLGDLQANGSVTDPEVLFAAVGDAFSDKVPLQIGQFESNNEMDNNLGNIYLEGNGGGQMHESYELALYFFARHTHLDSVDKRGEKGFLFIVGDELPYDSVDPRHIHELVDESVDEGSISFDDILTEVQQKYDVYFIFPGGSNYADRDDIKDFWKNKLGVNFIFMQDEADICQVIVDAVSKNSLLPSLKSMIANP